MRHDDYEYVIHDAWKIETVYMNNKAFSQLIKNYKDSFTNWNAQTFGNFCHQMKELKHKLDDLQL